MASFVLGLSLPCFARALAARHRRCRCANMACSWRCFAARTRVGSSTPPRLTSRPDEATPHPHSGRAAIALSENPAKLLATRHERVFSMLVVWHIGTAVHVRIRACVYRCPHLTRFFHREGAVLMKAYIPMLHPLHHPPLAFLLSVFLVCELRIDNNYYL